MPNKVIEMTTNAWPKNRASSEMRSMTRGRPSQIEALISLRAYELFVARGREPGHDLDDWLRAEMEVLRQRINTLAM